MRGREEGNEREGKIERGDLMNCCCANTLTQESRAVAKNRAMPQLSFRFKVRRQHSLQV